ncbi:MAG: alpha-L-fucosidase [Armatimonadota bacterium]
MSRADWFTDHMRQVHMDFHMPEFPREAIVNFDAEQFVGHLRRGKINMVALFAKCHFGNSFYDTQVGHKHSGLDQDFLYEAAAECRAHDIRTIAYYSLCCDRHVYDTHPHWRAIRKDGEPFPISGCWGRVCINTPYREELVLPQLEEIAEGYPVDGFFIDIPVVPECHCEYCRRKFEQMHGRELTPDIPQREMDAFLYASTARVLRELRAICDRHNPELIIVSNRSGRIDAPESFRKMNDVGVWESQPRNNYLSHSFATRTTRTFDYPVQVMSVRFYQGWGDLTLKPTAQMTTEFAAMTGNGGVASSGDQVQVDGTLQPAVYDMFAQAFGFVEEREEILQRAKTVEHAALLAPVLDPDLPADEALSEQMRGAHKALVESHVQFDILSSQDLGKLERYRYLVLPDCEDYAPEVFPMLREWVDAGGTLVACGQSLLRPGNQFELEDVFGVEYLEPSVFSVSHFRPRDEIRGETADLELQLRGRSVKVIPTDARPLADYIYPQIESTRAYAFRHTCAPPALHPSPYPFATINDFGSGRAVYVAGSIFRVYWETNHHWLRQFVEGLWSYLDPDPPCRVDISGIVESNLMALDDGDLLLNLIHYQVGHQGAQTAIPSIERVHPIHEIDCQVHAPGAVAVVLEPSGEELDFAMDGAYATFTVPEIEYMTMVRIHEST